MRRTYRKQSLSEPFAATIVALVFGLLYFITLRFFLNQNGCVNTLVLWRGHSPPLFQMLAFALLLLSLWCVALLTSVLREGLVLSARFFTAVVTLMFVLALSSVHYQLWNLAGHQAYIEIHGLFLQDDWEGRKLRSCWKGRGSRTSAIGDQP